MKSKDLQNIVLSKYQNGDTPTKTFRDLNSGIGLRTIKRWCQMILQSGSTTLSSPPGCRRLARTKGNIRKVKSRLRRKKRVSARKLSMELDISERSVRRILKNDLELHPCKKVVEPLLSDDQKIKRENFTKNEEGYVRNEDEVAHDLHSILTQVFQISYEYVASPFYVAGESYGGKYVPAIVRKIHVENPQAKIKINLKGMAIDDGLIDPYNQWDYGLVMYQVGLIDEQELERVSIQTQLGRRAIELKQYLLVSFSI
ncbi:unnamed protein product [Rotaria magnacalcarata]